MQNLKCDYIFKEGDPLRCTWIVSTNIPKNLQIFNIKVLHEGHILHSASTIDTSYKTHPDFIPYARHPLEVKVSVMTLPDAPSASTTLNLLYPG